MEVIKSVDKIFKEKPPAEPPPSLEHNSDEEMDQWIEDVRDKARMELTTETTSKIAWLQGTQYTPLATAQSQQSNIQQSLLCNQAQHPYRTRHPKIHQLHIPTPKATHRHQLTKISNKDKATLQWIQNDFEPFTQMDIIYPKQKSDSEITVDKWNSMIGKLKSTEDTVIEKINICTETVQSDTGANKAVTNNKNILYSYSDIDPYPIGGVKAVAIKRRRDHNGENTLL